MSPLAILAYAAVVLILLGVIGFLWASRFTDRGRGRPEVTIFNPGPDTFVLSPKATKVEFKNVPEPPPVVPVTGTISDVTEHLRQASPDPAKGPTLVKRHHRRPPQKKHFTDEQIEQMAALKAGGMQLREIGARFGCSHSCVIRKLQQRAKDSLPSETNAEAGARRALPLRSGPMGQGTKP